MKQTKPDAVNRRAFLKTSAAAGGSAAVATLLPAAAVGDGEARTTHCDGKKKGYRMSQHVLDYYRTAKV